MTIEFFDGGDEHRREDMRVFNRGCDKVLARLDSLTDSVDRGCDRVQASLDSLTDSVDRGCDRMLTRLDSVDRGCDRMLTRLDSMMTLVEEVIVKLESIIKKRKTTKPKPTIAVTQQKHNRGRFRCRPAPRNHSYCRQRQLRKSRKWR